MDCRVLEAEITRTSIAIGRVAAALLRIKDGGENDGPDGDNGTCIPGDA